MEKFIYCTITALFILSVNLYSNTIATYKVARGDTLFGIAFSHNMDVDDFLKINNIANYKNYNLKVGSNLKVYEKTPKKTTTTSPSNTKKIIKTGSKTTTYKVNSGDTLSGIAEKYNMGLRELYELNNIDSKYNLKVGDSINVYKKITAHKVSAGDTLSEIAEKYNMGLRELYELNNIDSKYNLKVGDLINVYKNGSDKTASKTTKTNGNKTTYKVKSGDTLFGIAFSNNMSIDAFLEINNIKDYKKYTLKVGSTLKVYEGTSKTTTTTSPPKTTKTAETENDEDTITYRVKKGDTLSEIALAHSMDIIEIYTINNLNDKHVLQIDEKLKVYNKSRILYTKTMLNYKVKNGDSLYGLARKFGMNINELTSLNKIKNINTYNLLIGSNLKVYEVKAIVRPTAKRKPKVVLPKSSFDWPYLGSIAVGYGIKSDKLANRGINIVARYGENVVASDEGVVEYTSLVRGYGMVVIIRHKNDYTTSYAHLSNIKIKVGDNVSKGDKIGSIGKTGFVEDYELYFKINYKGRPQNPIPLLPKG